MSNIIKQHLLCASHADFDEYFSNVEYPTDKTDYHDGAEDKFQIPTWPIREQLDTIEQGPLPKTGFIWYLIRKVINKEDGTHDIEIGFRQEMVWITESRPPFPDPYVMKTINDLLQYDVNSRILEKR